jgi:RNA polymerase sigma-70 factor, ECF subfamily
MGMGEPGQIESWVAAARGGDTLAVGKLLAAFHPVLRTRAATRLNPVLRARLEPEDVLQQVYLQVVRQIGGFRGADADAFVNWVLTILDHQLIDAWRALHRQVREVDRERPRPVPTGAESYADLLDHLYAESGTPSRIVRKEEALEALLACVCGLSEAHRQVIQLRFLEGLAVEEVAARLQTTKPAVVALTRRALDALRQSMDRMGDFTHHA